MKLLSSLLFLSVAVSLGWSDKVMYNDYSVYQVIPKTETEIVQLMQISQANQFTFWNEPTAIDAPVDVMVAPHQKAAFENLMGLFNFKYDVVIENVQNLIDEESSTHRNAPKKMEWTMYHRLENIYGWLDDLEKTYKEVRTIVGGKSSEGRDIKGIEINFGKDFVTVFIEAGIHAREWISPAGTSWVVNEILKSSPNSTFRQFNYIYFPIFNPDGYVYSWDTDRLWRKTRKPYTTPTGTCYGADPNRNWDTHWLEAGSSSDPCSETYAGSKPFSEIETLSMSNYTRSVMKEKKVDLYIAFHSYSQLLMFPWGYTSAPAPENDVWQKIGDAAVRDLEAVHGTRFRVGSIANTIYKTSGSSIEWVYEKLKCFLTFVYEMRDTGRYGFILPSNQIIPTGEEHFASLHRILEEYKNIKGGH